MKQSVLYSLKIWLTAIFFGALSLTVISLVNAQEMSSSVLDYLFFLVAFTAEAMLYSLVLFLLLFVAVNIVSKNPWNSLKRKFMIGLMAEMAYTILFCVIFHSALFKSDTLMIWPPFAVGIGLSVWIYKAPVAVNQ